VVYFVYTIADRETVQISYLKYSDCSPFRVEANSPGLKVIRHL
jgi:hypothetical protein